MAGGCGWLYSSRLSREEKYLLLLDIEFELKHQEDCRIAAIKKSLEKLDQKLNRSLKMNNCSENNQEPQPTTLYVGCLDIQVTEEYLLCLFSQIGPVKALKIIQEKIEPYAFIEFFEHQVALTALAAMNGRKCYGKEMKVNWSSTTNTSHGAAKVDTSSHFHVFVGDIGQDVTSEVLREAFAPHGTISDCKIVRDVQTLKSKGYGFITFVNKDEAEAAISVMNGHWLGTRSIRTNWATRRPNEAQQKQEREIRKQFSFDDVYKQTGPTNSTVYVGKTGGLDKEMIANLFAPFGNVREIRFFADKEYAFVLFTNKESATKAIVAMNNTDINGHTMKCWWGKEVADGFPGINSNPPFPAEGYLHQQYDQTSDSPRYLYPYGYGYGQQMNLWQQPGYSAAPPNMYQQVQQTNSQGKQTETPPGYFYGANYNYQQNFIPIQPENFAQNQQQHQQQQLQWTPQCLHYALGLNNWYDPGSQKKAEDSVSTVTDSSTNSDVIVSGPYSYQTK